MIPRTVFILCLSLILSLSLALSQSKSDCSAKTASEKKAGCCTSGMKTSMTTNTKTSGTVQTASNKLPASHPKIDGKDAKECAGMKECTAAEKAKCAEMMKTSNASMKNCTMKDGKQCTAEEKAKCEHMMKTEKKSDDGAGTH